MHWDPLHDLVVLRERSTRRPSAPDGAWAPSVDLLETDAAFLLIVELPGLGEADFSIRAAGNTVTLTGRRPAVVPPPVRYLRMERGHGKFSRSFTFGSQVAVNEIKASFDRGLLQITVPKTSSAGDRQQITIA
jgi:HSP20 family protein